jgi:hypothetical protein
VQQRFGICTAASVHLRIIIVGASEQIAACFFEALAQLQRTGTAALVNLQNRIKCCAQHRRDTYIAV